jgi:small subunit ribosomal protein S1
VVKARITNIDVENQRVSLSIKEFMPNEWQEFAGSHHVGDVLDGRVVNVTDFGLFIDIYNGLEGLAHVSEIEVAPGSKLEDHFQVGEWVRARILRIEEDEKKVGLSMRGVSQPDEEEIAELNAAAAAKKASDYRPGREAAKESGVVRAAAEEEGEETGGRRSKKAKAEAGEPGEPEAGEAGEAADSDEHSPEEE